MPNSESKAVQSRKNYTKEEKKFDRQKDLQTVEMGTIPERLLFTKDKFACKGRKAGEARFLTILMPPNTTFLFLEKGTSVEEIGMAANENGEVARGSQEAIHP